MKPLLETGLYKAIALTVILYLCEENFDMAKYLAPFSPSMYKNTENYVDTDTKTDINKTSLKKRNEHQSEFISLLSTEKI